VALLELNFLDALGADWLSPLAVIVEQVLLSFVNLVLAVTVNAAVLTHFQDGVLDVGAEAAEEVLLQSECFTLVVLAVFRIYLLSHSHHELSSLLAVFSSGFLFVFGSSSARDSLIRLEQLFNLRRVGAGLTHRFLF